MKTFAVMASTLLFTSIAWAQPGAGGPGGGGQMPANEVIFERNDTNEDGRITKAEAEAAETQLGANFDMFDLDSDGVVTAAELNTMRGNMGGGGAPAAPAGSGGNGPGNNAPGNNAAGGNAASEASGNEAGE